MFYILYQNYKVIKNLKKCIVPKSKKTKPTKIIDYLDLSEVNYESKGIESAIKILDNGIKKYPNEVKLHYQKIKLYFLDNQQSKIQEILKFIEANFK